MEHYRLVGTELGVLYHPRASALTSTQSVFNQRLGQVLSHPVASQVQQDLLLLCNDFLASSTLSNHNRDLSNPALTHIELSTAGVVRCMGTLWSGTYRSTGHSVDSSTLVLGGDLS